MLLSLALVATIYFSMEVPMADYDVKNWALENATQITKEAARGGHGKDLSVTLNDLYKRLIALAEEVESARK